MRVSIALATFNGAQYLQEQLQSLVQQTRMPDEVVICDDGSSDGTVAIIEAFANNAPFTVKFKQNPSTLGYTGNFEECIRCCNGDVVFISDQDDIWFPYKIASVLSHFSGGDELLVLINDQALTDANLVPLNQTTFGNIAQLGFTDDWNVTGCCTAMSRAFVSLALPFPRELFAYDGWIHALANALGVRKTLPQVLQIYRRHGANASNSMAARELHFPSVALLREFGMKVSVEAWQTQMQSLEEVIMRLKRGLREREEREKDEQSDVVSPRQCFQKGIFQQAKKLALMKSRLRILSQSRFKRFPAIWKFYCDGGYHLFQGWKSGVKDALRPAIPVSRLPLLSNSLNNSEDKD